MYTKRWIAHHYTNDIFLQMYIMETYRNLLFYNPFIQLNIVYDEDAKQVYIDILVFSKYKYERIIYKEKYSLEDFGKNFKKYINNYRKTTKRFSYHNISTRRFNNIRGEFDEHAMTVLYDKQTNELEFFQRDPGQKKQTEIEYGKKNLVNFFKYVYNENIKPVYNNNFCLKTGFFSDLCKAKNWRLNKRIYGDCMLWSLWYLELRLKNSDMSRRQVLNKTIKIFVNDIKKNNPDTHLVCKVILGYSTFIDNFTKQFYLIKTSKGQVIRINNKKSTPLLKKAELLMKQYLFNIRNYLIK